MSEKQDSELNDIIEGFKLFGSETDGKINPKEFKEIMDIMNMNEKYPFLYKIISNLCENEEIRQKGGLEADDFISLLDKELDDISTFEGLQKIFEIFSDMNTNKISLPVISQILNKDINLDIGEDEEKIKQLFSKPEISGKNIDFDEFNYLMKNDKEKSDIISNNKMYNINYNHQKIKDYENNESNSEKENKKPDLWIDLRHSFAGHRRNLSISSLFQEDLINYETISGSGSYILESILGRCLCPVRDDRGADDHRSFLHV